jgi:hypothetical protein
MCGRGGSIPGSPRPTHRSRWFSDDASVLTTTSPGPGCGSGQSSITSMLGATGVAKWRRTTASTGRPQVLPSARRLHDIPASPPRSAGRGRCRQVAAAPPMPARKTTPPPMPVISTCRPGCTPARVMSILQAVR